MGKNISKIYLNDNPPTDEADVQIRSGGKGSQK